MLVAVAASPPATCDISEVQRNVQWQKSNNSESVSVALAAWARAQSGSSDSRDDAAIAAMAALLFGQRHNTHVMMLYRACFKKNPNVFFDAVQRA
jgi:hypothetical protein